jgi:hypothetical protein
MFFLKKEVFKFNNWLWLLSYTAISLLIVYAYSVFIIKDEMYYNSLGDRLTAERIEEIINSDKQFNWINYAVIPLKFLVKITLPALCIYTGSLLAGYQIHFRTVFKVCLLAEVIFLIASVISLLLHLLFISAKTFKDLSTIDFFSLYALFRSYTIPVYLVYPLQVINFFELIYWFLLASGLQVFLEKPFGKVFFFVMITYGLGLLCWIVFVEFLVITYTS